MTDINNHITIDLSIPYHNTSDVFVDRLNRCAEEIREAPTFTDSERALWRGEYTFQIAADLYAIGRLRIEGMGRVQEAHTHMVRTFSKVAGVDHDDSQLLIGADLLDAPEVTGTVDLHTGEFTPKV